MGRPKKITEKSPVRRKRPAATPEARENQMIAMAYDLVEERLLAGTASPSETTHFLRLGSTKERVEKEILELQKELIAAKTEALQSSRRTEELYENAMTAFKLYSGQFDEVIYDE